jgi:Cd2+/Zn2+-exporting ATPase
MEAADMVIMNDDLRCLGDAVRIARKTKAIVWQNVIFSLAVKAGVLFLSLFGAVPMWLAVFADVGVMVLAVGNAMRAIQV